MAHFAYTAGMSQRPQPSCKAISVASVTGHDARSALVLIRAPLSKSSEMLTLLVVLRRHKADPCSGTRV